MPLELIPVALVCGHKYEQFKLHISANVSLDPESNSNGNIELVEQDKHYLIPGNKILDFYSDNLELDFNVSLMLLI